MKYLKLFEDFNNKSVKQIEELLEDLFVEIFDKWEIKEQVADVTGELKYKVAATFTQIPLKLCWAVTIHRAQGQTLDAALVELNGAFEAGQHYVALSRVRQLEHLSVVPFSHDRVRVHPACVEFYKSLEKIKC